MAVTGETESHCKNPPVSKAHLENRTGLQVSVIRIHLWLESGEGVILGPGRALLLEKIEEHGSLRKAAEDLGMSYRAAWGKIRKTERILGQRLIVQNGSKKEGHRLTEEGLELKRKYLLWLREIEREALNRAEDIFPSWSLRSFREKTPEILLKLTVWLLGFCPLEALILAAI